MSAETGRYSTIVDNAQNVVDSSKTLFEKIMQKKIISSDANQANIALQSNVKAISQQTQAYKAAIMSAKSKAKHKSFQSDLNSIIKND